VASACATTGNVTNISIKNLKDISCIFSPLKHPKSKSEEKKTKIIMTHSTHHEKANNSTGDNINDSYYITFNKQGTNSQGIGSRFSNDKPFQMGGCFNNDDAKKGAGKVSLF
jgi:hypothetical protein